MRNINTYKIFEARYFLLEEFTKECDDYLIDLIDKGFVITTDLYEYKNSNFALECIIKLKTDKKFYWESIKDDVYRLSEMSKFKLINITAKDDKSTSTTAWWNSLPEVENNEYFKIELFFIKK